MQDLADLFPGFKSHWINTGAGRIFARSGGSGEPLLLIHGFPQSLVQWHRIAPALAKRFHVVMFDLRGYGWSAAPGGGPPHDDYSKRAMGEDAVKVMRELGHIRFHVCGHDRGARVAYRLALDHPGRVTKLALLDILPTYVMWDIIAAKPGVLAPHWPFLAKPAPEPENEIGKNAAAWLESTLASWTKSKDLQAFDRRALDHYRAAFSEPTHLHGMCEDYRAGAGPDLAADRADIAAGKTIICPALLLWGAHGIAASGGDPLKAWKALAPEASGLAVDAGHFLPEENPPETLKALEDFF